MQAETALRRRLVVKPLLTRLQEGTDAMFTIKLNALKAAACAVSTEQSRYYLTGVHVEWTASGPTYVGTDGTKLIAARHDWIDETPPPEFAGVTIPASLIKKLKAPKGVPVVATVTLSDGAPRMVTITCNGAAYSEPETNGNYPAWKNVLPKAPPTNEPAQYDPALLDAMQTAVKALANGKTSALPLVQYNGGDPTLVDLNADPEDVDAFGVIMRFRVRREPIAAPPSWARP